jgi:hypothetical protein
MVFPPTPASDWFIVYNQFPQCVPKWGQFLRDNGVWKDANEINGCRAPVTTKSFSSSFFSFGGTFSVTWSVDDACTVNFIDDSSGKTQFTISSGNNQGGSTTKGGYKLPQGTINVVGSVSNGSVSGNNLAALAMELKDSSGFTVWSATNLI